MLIIAIFQQDRRDISSVTSSSSAGFVQQGNVPRSSFAADPFPQPTYAFPSGVQYGNQTAEFATDPYSAHLNALHAQSVSLHLQLILL